MATGAVVNRLLSADKHPEHGYRACRELLALAKRQKKARLVAACTAALSISACRYLHVGDILSNNRDQIAAGTATQSDWVSSITRMCAAQVITNNEEYHPRWCIPP